jgi:hypothetical protein
MNIQSIINDAKLYEDSKELKTDNKTKNTHSQTLTHEMAKKISIKHHMQHVISANERFNTAELR